MGERISVRNGSFDQWHKSFASRVGSFVRRSTRLQHHCLRRRAHLGSRLRVHLHSVLQTLWPGSPTIGTTPGKPRRKQKKPENAPARGSSTDRGLAYLTNPNSRWLCKAPRFRRATGITQGNQARFFNRQNVKEVMVAHGLTRQSTTDGSWEIDRRGSSALMKKFIQPSD